MWLPTLILSLVITTIVIGIRISFCLVLLLISGFFDYLNRPGYVSLVMLRDVIRSVSLFRGFNERTTIHFNEFSCTFWV